MKVYVVGIGMDGRKTLTAEAENAIGKADVLIGAKRMTEPFAALGKQVFECWKTDDICAFLGQCGHGTAAVLMSGDCGFFSGARLLEERLSGCDAEIIPGISTPVYMCAKLGLSWHDMKFVSLHGAQGNIVRSVCGNRKCFFLLGGGITPADICKRLCEYGMGDTVVHIGARLSYPDEQLISGTAAELSEVQCAGLCAVITENAAPERNVRTGIPDEEFTRGDVPMTKSEVRAAVASKLNVCYNDTVWDIGCGTGSVSVECALAANEGTVCAVDKNEAAVKLTVSNARKFGCDNIHALCGAAPEILRELPRPDKVFIGGAGGNIAGILGSALSPGGSQKAVITAVTLETLNEAAAAFREHRISPEITQISVTRTRIIGGHTMLNAQNPVFIIAGERT